jgi:MSHA type pilus biogenesis protein MshL
VIGNRESGILYVRATSKQHERVQEFLDQVMTGAKRQVLIEATVAEVQLRNEYQRGIEWQRLRATGQSGLSVIQPPISPPASFNPNPFLVGFFSAGHNFNVSVRLLEQFGDVRVLSSPKLTVLNNQTAILRVTRDIIYFTITPSTQPITIAGGAGATVQASFTTTPNVAAEGFMMSVLPYINDANAIVLNVKPTIRRRVDSAIDPNPALVGGTPNAIPIFETREFDSMLRLQSGETAVLAGLMQDATDQRDTGIPGLRAIPIIGEALSQRAELTTKTELVIFLRATVIRDPSLEGDFRGLRDQLPREDFFQRPNPQRVAPPAGSREDAARTDMSLLLEALKKAEKAKEEAQRRARDAAGRAAPRERSGGPRCEAGADTREVARDQPAARHRERRHCAGTAPGAAGGGARSQARRLAAAARLGAKVFEAKFREPNPRLPFYITMGALGVARCARRATSGTQLRPPPPLAQAPTRSGPPPRPPAASARSPRRPLAPCRSRLAERARGRLRLLACQNAPHLRRRSCAQSRRWPKPAPRV